MSGYFGMLRTDGAPVREDLLQEIARSLTFRGPDASCAQAKGGVFSNRRRIGARRKRAPDSGERSSGRSG
jgi:hypothetical protein